jgi:hypothetical protein
MRGKNIIRLKLHNGVEMMKKVIGILHELSSNEIIFN